MQPVRRVSLAVLAIGSIFVVAGCNGNPADRPGTPLSPGYSSASPATGSPTASGSPSAGDSPSDGSASSSPGDTASAGDTSSPGSSMSPGDGSTPVLGTTPGSEATPQTPGEQPSGAQPVSCTEIDPVRVVNTVVQPSRTTEVVTVVSDGNSVQSGTRNQTEFATPTLTSPLNTQLTDGPTLEKVASLVSASGKFQVLLSRPLAPDNSINTSKRPFSQPGTYVLYNASGLLNATVVVQCSGQEQNWTFVAESSPIAGQVNCAVEPKKSNSLALSVYNANC